MDRHLCISFRFLHGRYHGRGDGDRPEWPPSPLRAFQALVEASARLNAGRLEGDWVSALQWLECLPPPSILAPVAHTGSGYRLSVPNNAMDIVAAAWVRGNESNAGDASPATHRTMKTVRPTLFVEGDSVSFVWRLDEGRGVGQWIGAVSKAARATAVLGWGPDTVVGDARLISTEEIDRLSGERWDAAEVSVGGLRVPVPGTLAALKERHQRFLSRITPEGFAPPPPLSAFTRVVYRRSGDVAGPPSVVLSLLRPDASAFTSFDLVRRGLTVAGMVRHAVRRVADDAGWAEATTAAMVLGHQDPARDDSPPESQQGRFAYLPIPSIEPRGEGRGQTVGRVRRALVSAYGPNADANARWLRKVLPGNELILEQTGRAVAVVSLMPNDDRVATRYLRAASTWTTVTPVVLPGYDDPAHYRRRLARGVTADEQRELLAKLQERVDALLRKAIVQAGYPPVLARHAAIEWRSSGFLPGTDLAGRYGVPDHLKRFTRLHVRLRWQDPQGRRRLVPGPVCFGGGRFYGIGLFAAMDEDGG